jgi:hypothetical protein
MSWFYETSELFSVATICDSYSVHEKQHVTIYTQFLFMMLGLISKTSFSTTFCVISFIRYLLNYIIFYLDPAVC